MARLEAKHAFIPQHGLPKPSGHMMPHGLVENSQDVPGCVGRRDSTAPGPRPGSRVLR
jgi:hypothetical protein